jgi:hypothetical protein
LAGRKPKTTDTVAARMAVTIRIDIESSRTF